MSDTYSEPRRERGFRDLVRGLVVGLLIGVDLALWEAAALGWAGLPLPQGGLAGWTLGLYALTGLLAGGLAAVLALDEVMLLLLVGFLGGWLLSGKVGLALGAQGMPGFLGLALVPVGGLVAALAARVVKGAGARGALAISGLVFLSLGLPVNLHLLGSPFSPTALLVDGALLAVAGVVGSVVLLVSGDGRPPVLVALGLGGLLGGGLAVPVLTPRAPTWPVADADGTPLVLVIIDTLRADHLSLYGYPRQTSPNLDRRARIVYTHAVAAAPWTLPSVASLLTGRHVHRHGAGVNQGTYNLHTGLGDVPTLAEALAAEGYATAAVVTNPWLVRSFGLHRGFDTYDDVVGAAALPAAVHPLQALGLHPLDWPAYRPADVVVDRALGFVEAQERSRWFLVVHLMDVHGPHVPEPADLEALGGDPGVLVDRYDASIRKVDRELERLLAALPSTARVVVTADHGEQLGEARSLPGPVPPGTRHGHTLYEELLHVPLVVLGGGVERQRVRTVVSLVDVAPTLAAWGGTAVEGADGAVLPPFQPYAERPHVSQGIHYGPEQQAARLGAYKLIHSPQGDVLYDLAVDPGETTPVGVGDPGWRTHGDALLEALPTGGVTGTEVPVGLELQELLQRLGYAQ